ncbi:uncharacterized protein LOC110839677 isoform X4 [Zootermopsis nevadensis]|uniref:uncharacterized protein LOC110839677 isoform X4 n=1 Tax=Zootermopsis nevadensis TaxID=136037 RepID=UPI000B8EBD6B|nr:uncharacterized protein LOC110839677 isoform X4 [Zootermopsis nevadensis]
MKPVRENAKQNRKWIKPETYICSMRAVLLVSAIALLEAHLIKDVIHLAEERHLVSCVVTIVRQHYELGRTILISSLVGDDDLANTVIQTMHGFELWPLSVLQQSNITVLPPTINDEKIRSYILFTRTAEDLVLRVEELSDAESWDSRGRFLVVVTAEVLMPEQMALSIVQVLWDAARILNLVVLVHNGTVIYLYTWFPYTSHEDCDDVKDVVLINRWVMEEEGGFVRDVALFPYKFPSNFHGCPFKMSAGFRDQAEDLFVKEQFRRLNITCNYVSEIPLNASIRYKVETSITDAAMGNSDMSFAGLPLLEEAARFADYSFPYYVVKYNWFVPCLKPFSRLQRISNIFSVSVWSAMVIVFLLVTVASWWLAKGVDEVPSYTSFSSSLFNNWAVMVGVSVTEMPRKFTLKLTFLGFVWYCFAMSTVFQTFFTSFLVDPGYQKQLTTLEEILESGMAFGYRNDFDIHYDESSDWRHKELLSKREDCSPEIMCIDRIRETGNYATLSEEWLVQDYTNFINDHSFICPLNDDDTFFILISFYFPKGSFLLEFINRFISSSTESGMIVKMDRDRRYKNKDVPEPGNVFGEYFIFTLGHLSVAFYILLFGHSLSLLLFIGELLYHKKFIKL